MNPNQIAIEALKAAYRKQVELSNEGTIGIRVSKGAGGDISLTGDVESEEEVIRVLKENNFPAIVYAEEHSAWEPMKIGDEEPNYLVVLDGFDGSSALARDKNARGGTMLAISESLNPKYGDFFFGGITDFSTNRILYFAGGKVFLYEGLDKLFPISRELGKFQIKKFDSETKIHLDDPKYVGNYEDGITSHLDKIAQAVRKNFTSKLEETVELSGLNSSGAMCLDLAVGKVDAIGGVSAKGVFEQPAEYPIIKSLGGTIVDSNGKDIGENYWLEDRKLHKENPAPSLRASSPELARGILEYLHSKN